MSDVDQLNDAGATDGEKDLVADFLMREQDKLAGLEDDFGNTWRNVSRNDNVTVMLAVWENSAPIPILNITYKLMWCEG